MPWSMCCEKAIERMKKVEQCEFEGFDDENIDITIKNHNKSNQIS